MGQAARLTAALVLPPRESFSPIGAGAIALLARPLALARTEWETTVIGRPVAQPFPGAFRPARPALLLGSYGQAVAQVLRTLRPAVVEVHNRPLLARELASTGPPVALVLHNDPAEMRGIRSPRERAALARRLASIVCVSVWVRERLGMDGAVVLPNAIDLAALPAPAPPASRDNTILFAGRLVADKGADAFVTACAEALPALPGWRAVMIGADRFGPDSPDTPFLRALRPAAARAGVELAGWQPQPAVLEAMARAAIVVVPSRWPEPFGMTALEAMASGSALAYAPRGALPALVGAAGLPVDPDRMAADLVALARDGARRAALAQAGRARAEEFGLRQALVRLDALRQDIVAAHAYMSGRNGGKT
jgi:glycosyltransferase involved in cell wall biosynthesis